MLNIVVRGLFAALIGFSTPLYAGDIYVRCVQQQLAALEHDPGPLDGLLGRKTRAALASLIEATPELSEVQKLTRRSAIAWCRKIAETLPEMRKYTPSQGGVELSMDRTGDLKYRALAIQMGYAEATKFFKNEYGVELASQIHAISGDTAKEVLKRHRDLERAKGSIYRVQSSLVQRYCPAPGRFAGFAGQYDVTLCFPKDTAFSATWFIENRIYVTLVMVHELYHILQRELAQDTLVNVRPPRGRPRVGPHWMIEGAAVLAENAYLQRELSYSTTFAKIYENARDAEISLTRIRRNKSVREPDEYAVSTLAAEILRQRSGEDAFIDYWTLLGEGATWDAAFQSAFGIDMKAFEAAFEEGRGSVASAYALTRTDAFGSE